MKAERENRTFNHVILSGLVARVGAEKKPHVFGPLRPKPLEKIPGPGAAPIKKNKGAEAAKIMWLLYQLLTKSIRKLTNSQRAQAGN